MASAAGVSLIVSKWEVPFASSSVELIDVTPQLVALVKVDAQTSKMIAAMKDQKPLSLEEAFAIRE